MSNNRFKFRVWSEKLKRYYWSYAINVDGDLVPWTEGIGADGEDPGRKLTIEQCTGLKDKNGKLIYDGDVVVGSLNTRLIVFWDAISASYMVKPLDNCCGDRELHYYSNMDGTYNVEIIGNIHEMEKEK